MDANATQLFAEVTEKWFEEYYSASSGRRWLQQLQNEISDFSTTVTVQGQDVTQASNGAPIRNIVSYDQEVSYTQPSASPRVNPLDVVMKPFQDETKAQEYFNRLKNSSPAFREVPETTPDETFAEINGASDSGGTENETTIAATLSGLAVVLVFIGLAFLAWHRRRHGYVKHEEEPVFDRSDTNLNNIEEPPDELVVEGDGEAAEVSTLYTHSLCGYSDGGEQNTVDYDYAKVATLSLITENDGQDWVKKLAKLGPQYTDERNVYTIDAPAGKLGIVFDTPDEGPLVIFQVADTSVLLGKVNVGDRLLALDDNDVTELTAVNISRLIIARSEEPVRRFTFMRLPPKEAPELLL